jgi:hypothetical protein
MYKDKYFSYFFKELLLFSVISSYSEEQVILFELAMGGLFRVGIIEGSD